MVIKNLVDDLPVARIEGELFETILDTKAFKLERIVSTGQASPPGEWYDQDRDEWVLVLAGQAGLLFEGDREAQVLRPGDSLMIPAHHRHRVEWTAADTETVWLALHFSPNGDPAT
jgi:cupin 2 domain-containing protein